VIDDPGVGKGGCWLHEESGRWTTKTAKSFKASHLINESENTQSVPVVSVAFPK